MKCSFFPFSFKQQRGSVPRSRHNNNLRKWKLGKKLPLISATGTSLQGLLTRKTQWHWCTHISAHPPAALAAVHMKQTLNPELYIIDS